MPLRRFIERSPNLRYDLIVVGTSWGGLHATQVVLSGLPKTFPLPLVFVQHRASNSPVGLVEVLQNYCALPVSEAEDKEEIKSGQVYLAPVGYHLLIEPGNFALSTEAPVLYARPSIDVLFESAAEAYAKKVIGVILTGASQDGARGLAKIKEYGGLAIVEDPVSAEHRIMPEAALASAPVDRILPLTEIAAVLVSLSKPNPRLEWGEKLSPTGNS